MPKRRQIDLPIRRSLAAGMSASSSTTSQTRRCPSKCVSSVILQLVDTPKGEAANRSHVDISIDDVDVAIGHIEAIGGSVKKQPSIDPRPGSFGGEVPLIDWAVMQDPFGDEFCLVSPLSNDEIDAVVGAPESGRGLPTDRDRRAAGGRTGEVQPSEAR